jgi:prepilin-type N-terminal cleavage/methylation domain-containing protein
MCKKLPNFPTSQLPNFPTSQRYNSAFTLVELSIVLVIIGLIVGGVLTGRDLIHAAEIRSVVRDIEEYKTAVNTFKLKYDCLSGDCPNATDYFGARNINNITCQSTNNSDLTCNGDGNGQINYPTAEMFLFWQQLSLAKLIRGKYTGYVGINGNTQHELGINSPISAIDGAGFGAVYSDCSDSNNPYCYGCGYSYAVNYGNRLTFGMPTASWPPIGGIFTPKEAMSIDQKIDDGKPGRGLVTMYSATSANLGLTWGNINSCTTSSSNMDYNGDYRTANTLAVCALFIKSGL